MIPYTRDSRQIIPTSAIKIIGLGGAGTNILERIALDGMEGAELVALNTDIRTLDSCLAQEKIQLGSELTKGLGTGGDPDLGQRAALEAEDAIRSAVKGRRIVFLCAGLGGGTGSGAAPLVTRIARETGAFVVVFVTMPYAFEGKRRRDQAETSLNELAALSNALITFDNNRMGELVLAKQGIHEAFLAADHMICESMKAIIRLVIRPGLINIGLDDLMSALSMNRSRCLFGSAIATGKDRAIRALRNALASPLLDQGALLREAQTVLVHLLGGENLTLFEIELLMQRLQKFIPDDAHVLFGAAVDPAMGDSLSLTLISALPENSLAMTPRASCSRSSNDIGSSEPDLTGLQAPPRIDDHAFDPEPFAESIMPQEPEIFHSDLPLNPPDLELEDFPFADEIATDSPAAPHPAPRHAEPETAQVAIADFFAVQTDESPDTWIDSDRLMHSDRLMFPDHLIEPESPIEPEHLLAAESLIEPDQLLAAESEPAPIPDDDELTDRGFSAPEFSPLLPKKRPPGITPWSIAKGPKSLAPELEPIEWITPPPEPDVPKLKLGSKPATPQSELSFESTPRGRFEGETPNVFEGEDLDLPPFLRKKK
jgi:cell division protein FtsZ